MRIVGVAPASSYRSELRRSDAPGQRDRFQDHFRFSDVDVILDLSADAVAFTGHDAVFGGRPRRTPPDTYTEFGTLAYPDSRDAVDSPRDPVDLFPTGALTAAAPPKVSVVTFDGQLRPGRTVAQASGLPRPGRVSAEFSGFREI